MKVRVSFLKLKKYSIGLIHQFKNIFVFLIILSLANPVLAIIENNELSKCVVITHCVRENWEFNNVSEAFDEVSMLIESTPRTTIVERKDSYIHAEATTRWMHYIDDLEVKALPDRGIIQIRSESRVGIGDNGVNQKRVDNLAYRMSTKE